jgi:hypothetical protein
MSAEPHYSDEEYSTAHKAGTQKCLKRLLRWRNHEIGEPRDWDPEYTFSSEQHQPRDYLIVEERKCSFVTSRYRRQ